jgi:hypothetical protein
MTAKYVAITRRGALSRAIEIRRLGGISRKQVTKNRIGADTSRVIKMVKVSGRVITVRVVPRLIGRGLSRFRVFARIGGKTRISIRGIMRGTVQKPGLLVAMRWKSRQWQTQATEWERSVLEKLMVPARAWRLMERLKVQSRGALLLIQGRSGGPRGGSGAGSF